MTRKRQAFQVFPAAVLCIRHARLGIEIRHEAAQERNRRRDALLGVRVPRRNKMQSSWHASQGYRIKNDSRDVVSSFYNLAYYYYIINE